MLVEKPGLPSADMWNALCDENPKTKFIMCKGSLSLVIAIKVTKNFLL